MSVEQALIERSGHKCELCGSTENVQVLSVDPSDGTAEQSVFACETCRNQITEVSPMDTNHWRCLNDSMWSPVTAVQVVAYRMLDRLRAEGWPQDLLDMMYLEDDVLEWAKAGIAQEEEISNTVDSNGTLLKEGDDVTLIKDLVVKGANFTAKRGTTVKGIRMSDNPLHVEGKVNGTQIVLVAAYLKKL
ncbi:PhnA domain-containing protein [Thiomicrorhabdus indica]|uniref:PhnA domain-containing protein n=1 Tax=Thiomicrorhabdus indica TaxID=2267253 RepID=UPI002AA5FCB5|nr:PhnA domain-containing protein [Thiomicrorhabdus indica]